MFQTPLALLEDSNLITFLNSFHFTASLALPAHRLEITEGGDVDQNVKEQMDDEEDGDVGNMTA